MSTEAIIYLPDVPFSTEAKTKEHIINAFKDTYPKAGLTIQKITLAKKDNKYNGYIKINEQHEKNILDLKFIKIQGQLISLRRIFPYHQIYINKLPDNILKQQIEKYFSKFGKILNIQLLSAEGNYQTLSKKTNQINHCYIQYDNQESAQKCIFFEQKHSIKNKQDIRVVRTYKIGQNDETDKKLFLKISPAIDLNTNTIENQLNKYFMKFGELREKIRIEQIDSSSSKACIVFTNADSGAQALEQFNFSDNKHSFILRPFIAKQNNTTVFVGNLRTNVTEQMLKTSLENYGKITNCTLNPSKKPGIINAVVTFADEQGFKSALAQYKENQQFLTLFAYKPYIDIHMNANLRNEYNSFKKKDKKQLQNPVMTTGGIGMGYGMMPRINPNQTPFFPGMNQPMGGFNPNYGNPNMGMNNPNFIPPYGNNPNIPPHNMRPF